MFTLPQSLVDAVRNKTPRAIRRRRHQRRRRRRFAAARSLPRLEGEPYAFEPGRFFNVDGSGVFKGRSDVFQPVTGWLVLAAVAAGGPRRGVVP